MSARLSMVATVLVQSDTRVPNPSTSVMTTGSGAPLRMLSGMSMLNCVGGVA